MCKVLAVSESGYYRSLKPTSKQERQQRLLVKIKEIIEEHEDNSNYGVQRILLALSQIDIKTSYSTVYRMMKTYGQLKKAKRHPNGITREDAAAQKSKNLIQRDFRSLAPNQKWLSDITEVPCSDGKLYVSAVLDSMIYHSDRGSQFTSHAFRESLAIRDAIQSMIGTSTTTDGGSTPQIQEGAH
jgi:transposase InsO family protein